MKTKTKRVGSFLCFSSPDTDDNEKKHEKKQRRAKDSSEVDRSDKKNRRRLMSKIVKSISFKSNSSKRGGKLPKEPNRSQTREASRTPANKPHSESSGKSSDEASCSSSSSSASCSSSSSSPSTTSSSSSSASSSSCPSCAASAWRGKKTFMPPPAPRNYGYATGLFLVLLSLFVVVLCGRLCAILWTATWLYLVPRWRMSGRPPEFAKAAAKMRRRGDFREEEEEKKRIMMEGFLQRNRNLKSVNWRGGEKMVGNL